VFDLVVIATTAFNDGIQAALKGQKRVAELLPGILG
jgi:hypothetical protein